MIPNTMARSVRGYADDKRARKQSAGTVLERKRFLKSIAYPYQAEGDNVAYRMFVGPPSG